MCVGGVCTHVYMPVHARGREGMGVLKVFLEVFTLLDIGCFGKRISLSVVLCCGCRLSPEARSREWPQKGLATCVIPVAGVGAGPARSSPPKVFLA